MTGTDIPARSCTCILRIIRDTVELLDAQCQRLRQLADLLIEVGDLPIEQTDQLQGACNKPGRMLGTLPCQSSLPLRYLLLSLPQSEGGQCWGVALPGNERAEHQPATFAKQIADDMHLLDVRVI
jgi:hypothetical protein